MRCTRVRVQLDLAPAHRTKMLAHELAHAILHAERAERGLMALEAESVAFIVCDALGLDAGAWSFGYVFVIYSVGWQAGAKRRLDRRRLTLTSFRADRCRRTCTYGTAVQRSESLYDRGATGATRPCSCRREDAGSSIHIEARVAGGCLDEFGKLWSAGPATHLSSGRGRQRTSTVFGKGGEQS
jgi:hypothetical protein